MTEQATGAGRAVHRGPPVNKVPEVTVYFWAIKVLCITVGETAADLLNITLNLGLGLTSLIAGALCAVALAPQLRTDRYRAGRYWLAVALISIFGTLVTDNLTDQLRVPLEVSTVGFSVLLGLTFLLWYACERTLSIHTIVTRRRESFYWLAVLFTFALGTAAGDLMAEVLGLGHATAGLIVAAVITVVAAAWCLGLHPVLAFWIVYILTRPLGASLGDYLSQPSSQGGLSLGAPLTSVVFLITMLWIVTYLAVTRADVTPVARLSATAETRSPAGVLQTVVVLALLSFCAAAGYTWRTVGPRGDTAATVPVTVAAGSSTLGDLRQFRVITRDTLNLLNAGEQAGATTRVADLETAWDNSEAVLRPRDTLAWIGLDDRIDEVLRQLRASHPRPDRERAALTDLLVKLH